MSNTSEVLFSSLAIHPHFAHHGNLVADLAPKSKNEVDFAHLVRRVCSEPRFYEAVRALRRDDRQEHAQLAREHMGFALLSGTAPGSQLFISVNAEPYAFAPYIGAAAESLREIAHASLVTPFVLANGFVGFALRALVSSAGTEGHVERDDGDLHLTATGARLFFGTVELLSSFRAIDVFSWSEQPGGTFTNSQSSPARKSSNQVVGVVAGRAVVPKIQTPDVRAAAVAASDTVPGSEEGVFDLRNGLDEGAPIRELVDAFEVSGTAPSSKPQLSRPAVRIVLHELGLTEHESVGALRTALALVQPAAFGRALRLRSDLYGMTARAGKTFNNSATPPAKCEELARAAKRIRKAGWQPVTREQRADREARWVAWFTFLQKVELARGPLPVIIW